ncbi:glycosyltransferase involved in cell wall biosynthesis [Modicisalibacter xianhensis]|uniref:Glycosyltransferase involved in cell wall biosynthesis n=2 Tax=Modicisalibacter xianhensis TaxID=442341 RepID=A0A4R8FKY7_9GAMM|nr:glycosyltransferase involved in cell wall biosynthesis [Halomonas xianhensis]
MKILMLNSYYDKGGAARAALRLAKALPLVGVEVDYRSVYHKRMQPWEKARYLWRVAKDRLPGALKARSKIMFSAGRPDNRTLVESINASDADIVHIHWLHGGGLSIEDIARIAKPVVWSLHDMWAFTGGCHYDQGCARFVEGCGHCPLLKSRGRDDISRDIVKRKLALASQKRDLTIIGLSRWMLRQAARSRALGDVAKVNLPNPINTNVFAPLDKRQARQRLNLPLDKKLILFGAMSATDDSRKGYTQLVQALQQLDIRTTDVEVSVFGSDEPDRKPDIPMPIHYLGNISDDRQLQAIYSAADVMVVPSLQENLSNAIMESLACGTPVVCFDIGGNGDMVEHLKTGFLASPCDPASLSEGIRWVVLNKKHDELCENARSKVVEEFDEITVANKYLAFYQDRLVNNKKNLESLVVAKS